MVSGRAARGWSDVVRRDAAATDCGSGRGVLAEVADVPQNTDRTC